MSEVEVRLTGGPLADYIAHVEADRLRRDEHGRLHGGVTVAYQLQWWTAGTTPVWTVRYVIEPDTTPLRAHYGGYVVAPSTT